MLILMVRQAALFQLQQASWTDLTSLATGASGTISSITVLTGGDNAQLAAVEVNGCILVDGIQGKALLRSGSGSAGPQVTSFNPFLNDIEAVRGQETEYCTMNPLTNAQGVTLSDGNLKCTWSLLMEMVSQLLGH